MITRLLPFLPSVSNPEHIIPGKEKNLSISDYLSSISTIKFDSTFKSTSENRHLISTRLLKRYLPTEPVILDVGASTGTTSLELMDFLNYEFGTYFVTDHNLEIRYSIDTNERVFFYDDTDECILISGEYLVYYPKELELIECIFRNAISRNRNKTELMLLVDPRLLSVSQVKTNVIVEKYSIFDPWPLQTPNVIIVGNLLNRSYFSDEKLSAAINNLSNICMDHGYLLIVENRNSEQGGLYQKRNKGFHLVEEIGSGSDIHELII